MLREWLEKYYAKEKAAASGKNYPYANFGEFIKGEYTARVQRVHPGPSSDNTNRAEAGEFEKRKSRRRAGRRRTIVTGDLVPTTRKRTLLG